MPRSSKTPTTRRHDANVYTAWGWNWSEMERRVDEEDDRRTAAKLTGGVADVREKLPEYYRSFLEFERTHQIASKTIASITHLMQSGDRRMLQNVLKARQNEWRPLQDSVMTNRQEVLDMLPSGCGTDHDWDLRMLSDIAGRQANDQDSDRGSIMTRHRATLAALLDATLYNSTPGTADDAGTGDQPDTCYMDLYKK